METQIDGGATVVGERVLGSGVLGQGLELGIGAVSGGNRETGVDGRHPTSVAVQEIARNVLPLRKSR